MGVSAIVIVAGVTHRCDVFVFASSDTSTAEYSTHLPSGDNCGSPTRFIIIRSSKRIARFAEPSVGEPAMDWPATAGALLSGVWGGFVVLGEGKPNAGGGAPVGSGGVWPA